MRRLPVLVVMAKRPQLGRVKTRLARDVGAVEAWRFYRHQLHTTCRRLGTGRGGAAGRRWRLVLALTPDHAGPRLRTLLDERIGQGAGDLGVRMQRLFDTLGSGPLIIVGADIPALQPAMIARAFRALAGHDVVFGPAEDGGYWLVGQSRLRRRLRLFERVRWSSPTALADTLANAGAARVAFVDRLHDVDRGADLRRIGR